MKDYIIIACLCSILEMNRIFNYVVDYAVDGWPESGWDSQLNKRASASVLH